MRDIKNDQTEEMEGMTILCFHQEDKEVGDISDLESMRFSFKSALRGSFDKSVKIDFDFGNLSKVKCKSLRFGASFHSQSIPENNCDNNNLKSKSLFVGTLQKCIEFQLNNLLSPLLGAKRAPEQGLKRIQLSFKGTTSEQNIGEKRIGLGSIISGQEELSGCHIGTAEISLNYASLPSVRCTSLLVGVGMSINKLKEIKSKSLHSGNF